MLNALDLAGIPLHAADRTDERPDRARRRPLGVQPRADRGLHRRRRARRRRGGRARDLRGGARVEGRGLARRPGGAAAPARGQRRRLRAVASTTWPTPRTARIVSVDPQPPGHPAPGRQAHPDGPRRLALPGQAAGAAGRDRARAVQRGDLPRLHPGLPVLPGRDDHPPGARAVAADHRRDGRERHPRPAASTRSGCSPCPAPTTPRSATSPRAWPTATRAPTSR